MVKPDNYVMLLGWMRTELNLKGNELNLYAIIYGFTQDGETEFSGSIRYMQEWLGAESKQTVFNTLDKLIKKGWFKTHRGCKWHQAQLLSGGSEG